MGYLFGAYAVFWLVTFLLVFSIERRQRELEKEVEALRKKQEPLMEV
ncbi:MAG TPA: CcmD family protein [Chloroflexi bacterium]|nr:CcmD family protein [Chloroflexota bacterium]